MILSAHSRPPALAPTFLWLLVNALAAAEPTALLQVPLHELGYLSRNWTVEEGLPNNNVTALAQTKDGYLWAGTYRGLVRFDGIRFRVFDALEFPGLQDSAVMQLHSDQSGRLWIRSTSRRFSARVDDQFRPIPSMPDPSSMDGPITVADGHVFLAPARGARIQRWDGAGWENFASGPQDKSINQLMADRKDRVWGRWTQTGGVFRTEAGAFHSVDLPPSSTNGEVCTFFLRRNGNTALLRADGVWELKGEQWTLLRRFPQPVRGLSMYACEDGHGTIWFYTNAEDLCASLADGRLAGVKLPGAGTRLRTQSIITDLEGNVWIACEPEGLFRITRAEFRTWSEAEGLPSRRVTAVCADKSNGVWLMCGRELHWLADNAPPVRMPTENAMPRSLASARDGGAWFGDSKSGEVFRVLPGEAPRVFGKLPRGIRVDALLETRNGTLWAGDSLGIARWEQGTFVRESIPDFSHERGTIFALAEDQQSRVHAAVFGLGLFRRDESGWRRLTRKEDPGSARINGFLIESNGTIWATAQRPGLARWKDGRWFAFNGTEDAIPSFAGSLALDDFGGLWLATDQGVGRFDVHALNRWADGGATETRATWFGRDDGLGSIDCSDMANGVSKAGDGRIWFGTANGISVVNSKDHSQQNLRGQPPPVHIEEVLIDDKPVPPSSRITLPPGGRRVEFRFTALNLSAPEKTLFAYQLNGFEKDWVNSGTRRSAYYQRLPPGEYRFQVIAANKHQVWNRTGATLGVVVLPAWWQTATARTAFALLPIGLLAGLYGWRISRLKQQQAAREEFTRKLIASQEEERKRIAGELHDSLGQNLLVLKNRLFLATENANAGAPAQLSELTEVVSQSIAEVREISLNLHPHQLARLGLTKAIEANVRKVSAATRMNISAEVDLVDGLFAPSDEINLYRIVQEGLNNVVKHADASTVNLSVARNDGQVIVRLEDDGRGFDYAGLMNDPKRPRGLGLSGLSERTRILGGRFHCDSAPGAGTRLTIEIPVTRKNASAN